VNASVLDEPRPTWQELLKNVAETPLINQPYTYPIYSNVGISLLGLANYHADELAKALVASNRTISAHSDAPDIEGLLRRDIFHPLGLNSSFYNLPADKARYVAVPRMPDTSWAVGLLQPPKVTKLTRICM
jgi:CubicO group peptidase (beta-lactamase class C family)